MWVCSTALLSQVVATGSEDVPCVLRAILASVAAAASGADYS